MCEKGHSKVKTPLVKLSSLINVCVCRTGQTVINGESLPHVVSGVHPYSGIGK